MDQTGSILKTVKPVVANCLPHIAVDCVIFGYRQKQINVLCTHIAGMSGWLLTGGFVEKNENLDDAAHRVLEERTGIKGLFLKQFKTFGTVSRSLNTWEEIKGLPHLRPVEIKWLTMRFISVGYYALTEFTKVDPRPSFFDDECRWFDINSLPPLLQDHAQMVKDALKILQLQIHHEPIGYNLLPAKFTLPEMQALYETILNKKLDQRNFTKKLVSLGIINKLNEKKYIGGHRSPSLYKFNKLNYNKSLKEGISFAF